MIKFMIMNKDLTEVYAGTTVYDNEQWANKQFERLQCSNNWSVKQVKVEPEVILQGELLPCPFCGSEDIRKEERSKGYWIVTCNNCWANLRNLYTEEIAINTWNKRAGREPQSK